jgi:hypothetical protein
MSTPCGVTSHNDIELPENYPQNHDIQGVL